MIEPGFLHVSIVLRCVFSAVMFTFTARRCVLEQSAVVTTILAISLSVCLPHLVAATPTPYIVAKLYSYGGVKCR